MKIIDNFLSQENFLQIKDKLLNSDFPWYYNDGVNEPNEKHIQFIHYFYKNGFPTNSYNVIFPLIKKINPVAIARIKANLVLQSNDIIEHGMHCDYNHENLTTAIYYVNSNNGYTKFKNGEKIKSLENRLIIFKCNLLHSGTTCTDKKRRVIINLNFT